MKAQQILFTAIICISILILIQIASATIVDITYSSKVYSGEENIIDLKIYDSNNEFMDISKINVSFNRELLILGNISENITKKLITNSYKVYRLGIGEYQIRYNISEILNCSIFIDISKSNLTYNKSLDLQVLDKDNSKKTSDKYINILYKANDFFNDYYAYILLIIIPGILFFLIYIIIKHLKK